MDVFEGNNQPEDLALQDTEAAEDQANQKPMKLSVRIHTLKVTLAHDVEFFTFGTQNLKVNLLAGKSMKLDVLMLNYIDIV